MYEYPLRGAKALRPALCIATSRALGGSMHGVLRSAAVIELYHNAFLIHDDIEDQSHKRRDQPTLHLKHGLPVAVNVGDAMLALALGPLLDNMRLLGMGPALRILQFIARMARESAEGQALELMWARGGDFRVSDRDYLRMVHKKTGWYTFLTPVLIGATVAGASQQQTEALRRFATALGSAFQIQDDILNLRADEGRYGKEIGGDLWEGKHTLMLLHAVRSAGAREGERALEVLRKPRPPADEGQRYFDGVREELDRLVSRSELTASGRELLLDTLCTAPTARYKTAEDVEFLADLIQRHRSIDYAQAMARRRALRARRTLERLDARLSSSVHLAFLHGLVDFVVQRDH
jgi:geranylgeranyl diphosphate synthase type II